MKKAIIAIVLAVALAGASWFGYAAFQDRQFQDKLTPLMKNSTVRLQTALELEQSEKMTWKEFFERSDGYVSDIDKIVIQIKEMSPSTTAQKASAADAEKYMKSAQTLIRAQAMFMHASFDFSNRRTYMMSSFETVPGLSFDYWKQQANRAIDERNKSAQKQNSERNEYQVATVAMQRAAGEARSKFGDEVILPDAILKTQAELLAKVQDVKDVARITR